MYDFFRNLLMTDFVPHAFCMRQSSLVYLSLASDVVIAVAYFLIPLGLVRIVRLRRDLEFSWMFLLFGAFILSCGMTHVMGGWTLWHPAYRLEDLVKIITALVSLPTALLLLRLVPRIVALPSPAELRAQISQRESAEHQVRKLNAELEMRVLDRTAALAEANRMLAESENRRLLALEAAKMGTWFWSPKGNELFLDARCKTLFDLPGRGDMTYARLLEAMHPEDRRPTAAVLEHAIETRSEYEVEFRAVWRDGSEHWIRSRGQAHADHPGAPERLRGVVIDVTEQKQTYQALRTSETRFRTLAETVPDMLFATDAAGRVTFVSSRFAGYTGPGLEGFKLWGSFLHWEDQERADQLWRASLESGKPFETEFRIRRRDGMFRWFLGRALPMPGEDGRVLQWLGACADIDQLKRTEEELRYSNQELSQFAYAAAHDLQEPLRNVVNAAELFSNLYREEIKPQGRQLIEECIDSSRRMHAMMRDLLAYTRVVDVKEEKLEPISLAQAVGEAMAAINDQTTEPVEVRCGQLPVVLVNRGHMVQLFASLIGNSMKFRKPDVTPVITIQSVRKGEYWEVALSDNGIGFDPAYKERIFGVFKRLHQRNEYEGTGIGLAICARIVAHYGGQIQANATPGDGATFWFTLPARDQTV